jgi:hypothetical protein
VPRDIGADVVSPMSRRCRADVADVAGRPGMICMELSK